MSAGPSVPGATDALKRFELENNISEIDQIYSYDNAEQQQHLQGNPWRADPKYFKKVRISATALIKMVMHARSGGISGNYNIEVMGLMQGKIDASDPAGPTFIVMDTFALPIEATETRVNAQADAYEYMVEYQSMASARQSRRAPRPLICTSTWHRRRGVADAAHHDRRGRACLDAGTLRRQKSEATFEERRDIFGLVQ